jgi:hypothetical protein
MDTLQGLPDWARAQVEREVKVIKGGDDGTEESAAGTKEKRPRLTSAQAAILRRLTTDPRMGKVWKELTRHQDDGEFKYPARPLQPPMWWQAVPEISPEDPDSVAEEKREANLQRQQDIQAAGLAQVIPFTFRVVVHPKFFTVRTLNDIEKIRKRLGGDISTLRRLAKTSVLYGDALRQEAAWLQEAKASLPGADDPFVIERNRGDGMAKGIQIRISQLLEERFGIVPGSRTATTLAEVALDLAAGTLSERHARSAFRPSKQMR